MRAFGVSCLACFFGAWAVVQAIAFSSVGTGQAALGQQLRGSVNGGQLPASTLAFGEEADTSMLGVTAFAVALGLVMGFASAPQTADARPWPAEPDGTMIFKSTWADRSVSEEQRVAIRESQLPKTWKEFNVDSARKAKVAEAESESGGKEARVAKQQKMLLGEARNLEIPA